MGSKKSKNGIFFEATEAQKRKIKKNAALCGMRQGEYILRRALGYEPKAVQPNALFILLEKIGDLESKSTSVELNAEIEELLKEITAVLLLPGRERK